MISANRRCHKRAPSVCPRVGILNVTNGGAGYLARSQRCPIVKGTSGGAYWFHEVTASFYLALFLLWWWIGWQIDVKHKPRNRPRMAVILRNSPGLPLSLVCLYASGIF
jgi:hypothetical protein